MAANSEVLDAEAQKKALNEMKQLLESALDSSARSKGLDDPNLIKKHQACFKAIKEIISLLQVPVPDLAILDRVLNPQPLKNLSPKAMKLYIGLISCCEGILKHMDVKGLVPAEQLDEIVKGAAAIEREQLAGQDGHNNGFEGEDDIVDDDEDEDEDDDEDEDHESDRQKLVELEAEQEKLQHQRKEFLANIAQKREAQFLEPILKRRNDYARALLSLENTASEVEFLPCRGLPGLINIQPLPGGELNKQLQQLGENGTIPVVDVITFLKKDLVAIDTQIDNAVSQLKQSNVISDELGREWNKICQEIKKNERKRLALQHPQSPASQLAVSSADFKEVLKVLRNASSSDQSKKIPGATCKPIDAADLSKGYNLTSESGPSKYKAEFKNNMCTITGSEAYDKGLKAALSVFKKAGVKAVDIDFTRTGNQADNDRKMLGIIETAVGKNIAPVLKMNGSLISAHETLQFLLKQDPTDAGKERAAKYVKAVLNSGDPALTMQLTDNAGEKAKLDQLLKENKADGIEIFSNNFVAAKAAALDAEKSATKQGLRKDSKLLSNVGGPARDSSSGGAKGVPQFFPVPDNQSDKKNAQDSVTQSMQNKKN